MLCEILEIMVEKWWTGMGKLVNRCSERGDLGLENGHVGLGNAVLVFGNVKCGVGLFCFGVGNGKWRFENGGVPVGLSCFRVWFCVFYDCFSGSYEEDKQDYGA